MENNEGKAKKSGFILGMFVMLVIVAVVGVSVFFIGKSAGWFDEKTETQNSVATETNEALSKKEEKQENSSKEDKKTNTKKNESTENKKEEENNDSKNVKKIEITDEQIIDIMKYEAPFENGQKLTDERYLAIVYGALNDGTIVIDKNRSPEAGKGKVAFTADEINSVVYSLFGVTLQKNGSYGTSLEYKNGKYTLEFSDRGSTVYKADNVEYDTAAGTRYITFDVVAQDESSEEKIETYTLAISNVTGYVSSLKK